MAGRAKQGSLDFQRGRIEVGDGSRVPLRIIDAIPRCTGMKNNKDKKICSIKGLCHHEKRGQCQVRLQFIASISKFYTDHADKLDEFAMNRIGLFLIPRYDDYMRLQMEKLIAETLLEEDNKGTRMHPIFDAIDKIIRSITTLEKDLKIEQRLKALPELTSVGKALNPNMI